MSNEDYNKKDLFNIRFMTGTNYYTFSYIPEITVKEMLLDFASKLNLNNILDPVKYAFMYGPYLLNNSNNLSKSLNRMFGKHKDKLIIIKVIDNSIVLG